MGAKKPESEDQLCLDCCSHTTSVGVTHRLVQNAGSQASPSPPQSALWSSTPSEAAKHSTAFIFLLLLLCVCAYGCPRACRGSESNSVGGVSSLPIPRGFHVARLGSKHLSPLSRLTGPQPLNLKHEGSETWMGAGA